MKKAFLNQVRLDPELVRDRDAMSEYMRRNLDLPCWFGGNLDALADVLSELSEETVFEVEAGSRDAFAREGYPKRVLRVILEAVRENPHLHLYLTDEEWMQGFARPLNLSD